MSEYNLAQHLAAGRPGSYITGLNPDFATALQRLYMAAPANIRAGLAINSGFRSVARQAQLYQAALAKYGDEATARRWVAPPGRSQHNHGNAVDFGYASPAVQQWVRANAAAHGLHFPLAHEKWHAELIGARKGKAPTAAPAAGAAPAAVPPPSMAAGAPPVGQNLPQQALGFMARPAAADPALLALSQALDTGPSMIEQQARRRREEEAARTAALFGAPAPGLAGLFS